MAQEAQNQYYSVACLLHFRSCSSRFFLSVCFVLLFLSFCFKDELLVIQLRCVVSPKHCQLSVFWGRFGQAAFSVMNIFFEITTLNYTICHNVKAMKEKRIKPLGRDMYFSLKFSSILAIFHQSDKKLFVRASWNEESNIQSQKD